MTAQPWFHWSQLKKIPSAWLLLVQLIILVSAPLLNDSLASHAISWSLSACALLLVGLIIQRSPIFSAIGLVFVLIGLGLSSLIAWFGYTNLSVYANVIEAISYFYAAAGIVMYMFEDHYLSRDELFAAAAVFTLSAWGFAFLYAACQSVFPSCFTLGVGQTSRSWLELLYLSFSLQSGMGFSDVVPTLPAARVLTALHMFSAIMYMALIVSRLVALKPQMHRLD